MSANPAAVSAVALATKKQIASSFFKKGVFIAVLSGMCYGLYSAFITLAMSRGVWDDWYGVNSAGLTAFVIVYVLAALGSAINDTCSAVWAFCIASVKGKVGDYFRTINTKPGRIMIAAALVGGPIAGTAYVAALQLGGSIIIPVTALCPAIGAILSRVLFKQKLNRRMVLGIVICFAASFIIGMSSVVSGEDSSGRLLGILIALIAAFGWGLEGCVAGYGTSMIDSEIGITIRQSVSGLSNLFIVLPVFAIIAGNMGLAPHLFTSAITDGQAMPFFIISGFFALFAFSLWYKGNSMCGTALGMACNGMYSFWGPFFCWMVLGIFAGIDGWAIPPVAWFAAVLMAVGIFLIAVNPMELFKKKEAF